MTTRAREALADCEHALTDYAESANSYFQRPRWVAVITLLRTVLDVLEKIDGPAGTRETRRSIEAARKRLFEKHPESRIYHEFIENERNNVVHLYEVSARVDVTIRLGDHSPATYDFVMRDGPFRGRDPRELCSEAIKFWRRYLDDIDGGSAS